MSGETFKKKINGQIKSKKAYIINCVDYVFIYIYLYMPQFLWMNQDVVGFLFMISHRKWGGL